MNAKNLLVAMTLLGLPAVAVAASRAPIVRLRASGLQRDAPSITQTSAAFAPAARPTSVKRR